MERFPKLALLLNFSHPQNEIEESFSLPELTNVDILYFYGIATGSPYSSLKEWLHKNPERRLVFLSDDFNTFLQSEKGEEILLDSQVVLDLPSEVDTLVEKFPFSKIEVSCFSVFRTKKFQSLRLEILRKTTLSHALHLDRLHGYQPFINFLRNIRQLPLSFYANGLKGKFRGIPAIVCGAGPSLEKAIPYLKKMEQKGLIIAGGSTLAALSSQGITPHFGMAIDPNLEEFKRLKNSFSFEVPFLYSTRVFPEVFQTCNGPFGYMRSGIGGLLELWMEEKLGLTDPLLGEHLSCDSISVTSICVAWAEFLGCNPIVLSGVDLAYTDQKQYASGVKITDEILFKDLNSTSACNKLYKRKNQKGKTIYTAVRWLMERDSLSHFAKMHCDKQFINTTENGLKIQNILYKPLGELLDSFGDFDSQLRVQEEIFLSPMPLESKKIIENELKELSASLDRVVAHLTILSQRPSVLDEFELIEESAYSYIFYDVDSILNQELDQIFPCWPATDPAIRIQQKWRLFLDLAKKYQRVFKENSSDLHPSSSIVIS